MKLLANGVAFIFGGEQAPSSFQSLTELSLVIMVGLTGVGKSTVLNRLAKKGIDFTVLPDRRKITDQIIIASLQKEAGEVPWLVTDRVKRFEYTARYRAKFPGGMAHALSQLVINPVQTKANLIFDGLRGLNEVQQAVTYFPKARFVVLDAPDIIRLKRLLKREDAFDTTKIQSSLAGQNLIATLMGVPDIKAIFSEEQLRQIARTARAARISNDRVAKIVTIIVEERRNYDSNASRVYLNRTLPPKRVRVVNTVTQSAETVAQQVVDWLT